MRFTVLGDGSWGTACALLFAENGHTVDLWCYNHDVANEIQKKRKNSLFLPGFTLPETVVPTTNLLQALNNEIICEAIPVPYLRNVLKQEKLIDTNQKLWVILSKGIEEDTHRLPSEILTDIYGNLGRIAVLSGPSFAQDVAKKQPTIVSLATISPDDQQVIKELCENDFFTCAINSDPIGTQLLGAFKNVIALGAGLLDGSGFGTNTRVFFILKCIDEIAKLLIAKNGQLNTLYSPAGIGDLMLTCFGTQSRNYLCGLMLGQGKKLDTNCEKPVTTEGINTLKSVCYLAKEKSIEMPVICALADVIIERQPITRITTQLRTYAV